MEEQKKSTHKVEVVRIRPEVHPNADKMWVARVFGYTCCIGKDDWGPRLQNGECLAAYLPPDSLVDVKLPEFCFLVEDAKADGFARIRAKRLRGVVSFGLLVPAPEGSKEGDDVAEQLNVGHYEPPLPGEKRGGFYMGGEVASGPPIITYKYDVDAFRRYHHLFIEGEPVLVTEKLDGANSRFTCVNGQMYCGSRTEWKKEFPDYSHVSVEWLISKGLSEEKAKDVVERLLNKPKRKNLWWEILEKYPTLEKFCRDNPGMVVYGETYGNINLIKYGLPDGNRFAAFDVLMDGKWVDALDGRKMLEDAGVDVVPLVGCIPYNFDTICGLAEGTSTVLGSPLTTIREGVVVKPLKERFDDHIGRVCFKAVGAGFLEKYK